MTCLFQNHSSNPKANAQRNLAGRTHYVDDDTLRFHKSRIISARHVFNGLLFAIVTSDAMDMNNTRRGFRYVVFDLFGRIVSRVELADAVRTSQQAEKAMWAYINAVDAKAMTLEAIDKNDAAQRREADELRAKVRALPE